MSGSAEEGHNANMGDRSNENESDTDTGSDLDIPSALEEELYALAVESTQVVTDLLYWTDYDNTEIGTVLCGTADQTATSVPTSLHCALHYKVTYVT